MAPKIDAEIIKGLSLDASTTTIASHGGGGFASTSKITGMVDGREKLFFVKTGKGSGGDIMFTGILILLSSSFHQPKKYKNKK
jgi:protein-ribulosamine 3-kinase